MKCIVIVGDLPERPDRQEFLCAAADAQPEVDWRWVQSNTPAFNLPQRPFRRLLAQLRDPPAGMEIIVVKLACIHGRDANSLFNAHPDPVLAPKELTSADALLEWLLSEEAALVREPAWTETCRAAAMLAIFAKLIRNKSWNKSQHGHQWTKEADHLGQAPVNRPDGLLYGEATALLAKMEGNILLTKGGKQSKTQKEWCVRLEYMPHIKQAILTRSLEPLREVEELLNLMIYVDECDYAQVVVDDDIINETVRFNCRQLR